MSAPQASLATERGQLIGRPAICSTGPRGTLYYSLGTEPGGVEHAEASKFTRPRPDSSSSPRDRALRARSSAPRTHRDIRWPDCPVLPEKETSRAFLCEAGGDLLECHVRPVLRHFALQRRSRRLLGFICPWSGKERRGSKHSPSCTATSRAYPNRASLRRTHPRS